MPIGDLRNKISRQDIEKVRELKNPPEYEPGFEPGKSSSKGDGGSFDDLFSDKEYEIEFDDLFGSDFGSPEPKGGESKGESLDSIFGDSGGLGSSGGFGQGGFGQGGFGSPFGGGFGSPFGGSFGRPFGSVPATGVNQQNKPDRMDKLMDAGEEVAKTLGKILVELFKSLKVRTADDFAYLSRNFIMVGLILGASSIGAGIFGLLANLRFLKFSSISGQTLGCGLLMIGTGLIGMGVSALKVQKMADNRMTIEQLPDVSKTVQDDATDEYESNLEDIWNDIFGDDTSDEDSGGFKDGGFSSSFSDSGFSSLGDSNDVFNPSFDDLDDEKDGDKGDDGRQINYEEKLKNVPENRYLTREILVDTFKDFFPTCTPDFSEKREISPNSEEFETLEAICLKALSNVANCDINELDSHLESAYESYFSYELRIKRVKKLTNLDAIARELQAYFRESSNDLSVNATVDIEGDFYKAIITKGVTAVVTFGDAFKQQYVVDYYLNDDNKLPIMVGISELGDVILSDAKAYDTMLIAGRPRWGKSWYVLSILMSLILFNTPEDVQFIIIDPKESFLFKTVGLLPHVCGVHNAENVLDVLRDVIEVEAPRRKKLLIDNKCDDIWALRRKGIKLPILYIFIDEVISVVERLGSLEKEFNSLLRIIISQLPSLGVRLILVPHRALGILDKTNRVMVGFSAAVGSNPQEVKDTLDINRWDRQLVNKGDVAVKLSDKANAIYVRGVALTRSDEENNELILNAAKVFYKFGVDIPDMSHLRVACNRDEDYVRQELSSSSKRIQYDASNIFNVFDDLD